MTRYVDSTEQLVVEVFVRDLERSIAFYRRLGFALLHRKAGFAVLVWEDHRLFLEERADLPPSAEFPQGNMRVMVPDVDAYWARAAEMGVRVINPIGDRDYGLRDFTIADPDGFGVRFGTRLPNPR